MPYPATFAGPQTRADWAAQNPYVPQFEFGQESDEPHGLKVGPGYWNDLPYINQTGIKVYRATVTQSGDGAATATSGTLTVGVRYKITDYQTGDDFTNVGAATNALDVEFIATGTTPTDWTNTSELTDTAAPIATVLENTLGGELVWTRTALGSYAATLTDAFPDATKVFIRSSSVVYIASGDVLQLLTMARATPHEISVTTTDMTANLDYAEWGDIDAPIEILVYP